MLAKLEQMRRGRGVGEGSPSMCRQGGERRPGRTAASEIEEVPPSTTLQSCLLAMNAAAAAGMASSELERKRAAVESRLRQLRRERERGGEPVAVRDATGGDVRCFELPRGACKLRSGRVCK